MVSPQRRPCSPSQQEPLCFGKTDGSQGAALMVRDMVIPLNLYLFRLFHPGSRSLRGLFCHVLSRCTGYTPGSSHELVPFFQPNSGAHRMVRASGAQLLVASEKRKSTPPVDSGVHGFMDVHLSQVPRLTTSLLRPFWLSSGPADVGESGGAWLPSDA